MSALAQVRRIIADLKHPADGNRIPRLPVLVRQEVVALVRPIPSQLNGEADGDALLMAEWRNLHKRAFFTWITAAEQSTACWLAQNYSPNDEDILFMVETPELVPFGHFALYNFRAGADVCEFGRVVRGRSIGPKGGMTVAAACLLQWAASRLGVRRFFLEVFQDNAKAVAFYQRLGFGVAKRLPLRRVDDPDCTRWEKIPENEADAGNVHGYAFRMEATAEQLHSVGCRHGDTSLFDFVC